MNIIRKARGKDISKKDQRVFFCCADQNFNQKDMLISDLLSQDAGIACIVSWVESGDNVDTEALRNELQESQLLVLWVTAELLESISDGVLPIEYRIAREIDLPVLPIANDGELFPSLTEKMGAIHGVAKTEPEYRVKLKKQLETFLATNLQIKEIQDKAFTAEIFLSYRKMDVDSARYFMKALHDIEGFESVSVWYDNFLTAGRNFNYEIEESINNSDAFVLLVTPNLATEGNYVQTTEYPFAYNNSKAIIPIEVVPTDSESFSFLFPNVGTPVNINDPVAMRDSFLNILPRPEQQNRDGESDYLLGMAYLKGFGVEKDANRAIQLFEGCVKGHTELALKASQQLSRIYQYGMGVKIDYVKDLEWRKKCVDICEQLYGTEDIRTANAKQLLAGSYILLGEYDQAVSMRFKALEDIEKKLGNKHPAFALSCKSLAYAYGEKGAWDKALEYNLKALEIYIETDLYINIGACYNRLGESEKALEWFQKALEAEEEQNGKDTPAVACIYNNIGVICNKNGEYDRAIEWYQQALVIREKVLGKEHKDTSTSYSNIGIAYENKGEREKALEWRIKAADVQEKLFPEKSSTATTLWRIGDTCRMQKKYDEAIGWFLRAMAIEEKLYPEGNSSLARTYWDIGNANYCQKKYDEAVEWFSKAMVIEEKLYPEGDSSLARTYWDIGNVNYCQKKYDGAIEWFLKALAIREKVLGKEHPETVTTYKNIANSYSGKGVACYNQGEYDEALKWYQQALEIRERVLGEEHLDTAILYNNIGHVYYYKKGEYNEALSCYQKALVIREKVLGEEHQDTAISYNAIGNVYYTKGEYDEALSWYQKALAIREKVLGKEHQDTLAVVKNMETAESKANGG